jgi:hypothetical protein
MGVACGAASQHHASVFARPRPPMPNFTLQMGGRKMAVHMRRFKRLECRSCGFRIRLHGIGS